MDRRLTTIAAATGLLAVPAAAQIIGQHHFTWWDDPVVGITVTAQGAPAPTPNSIPIFTVDEWHLSQAATASWYGGLVVAGLPANPFNPANINGMTPGSVIVPVAGAEAFIYQITNVNYFNGNGPPPNQAPPFSFTGPAGVGAGQNDLSGINIKDTHGALNVAQPVAGSQFMASTNLVVGRILDLTAGSAGVPASQDWVFNAFTGAGNFEWDIHTAGIGAAIGLQPVVFGFAMPGNWLDAVNQGHVHSWTFPAIGPPLQVNVAGSLVGFSGPMVIPEPAGTAALLALGGVLLVRRAGRRA